MPRLALHIQRLVQAPQQRQHASSQDREDVHSNGPHHARVEAAEHPGLAPPAVGVPLDQRLVHHRDRVVQPVDARPREHIVDHLVQAENELGPAADHQGVDQHLLPLDPRPWAHLGAGPREVRATVTFQQRVQLHDFHQAVHRFVEERLGLVAPAGLELAAVGLAQRQQRDRVVCREGLGPQRGADGEVDLHR
ncbi:ParA family protein [Babesia caballi]|uniref:ParA family protein n=1 Tax=Babesia caballi TaxID=5871 RepID=A0AAV4LLR0_BABCB|nr:ParA family protein [Babesia caballi]